MKRTSIFSAVLVTAMVFGVPTIAWSHINPDVSRDGDIAEDRSEPETQEYRGLQVDVA